MNRRWLGLALAGLLLVVSPVSTRAEDEPASADASPLETRLYDVRALLWGATSHTADRGPYVAESWDINDNERPLFGAEGEERRRLLGSAPDLVEHVKFSVGRLGTWDRESVSLHPMADAVLAVTAGPTEHDAIADLLARETRRTLATAVVDVALLAGDAEALRQAGGAAAGRARLLACGRALVPPGGRSVARHGALHAVLNDVSVFVAKDARAPDPWIGVVPDGMACEAAVVSAAPGGVTVRVK
ncbi:MAG TPA: hypothetical protein VND21_00640, partial [Planctomycetota bacterium]|nr:hypothetical protein [Planctomycetota bacterium]